MRIANHLINRLPPLERARLQRSGELVDLGAGESLCEAGSPYRHVYFPVTALVSAESSLAGEPPLAIRLIGAEGMLGATLALGIGTAPLRAVVQRSGTAWRMTVADLRGMLGAGPALPRVLLRYLYTLLAELTQGTRCMRFHELDARLARWLLMIHDRTDGDHLRVTHSGMADLLGVRRSGVTIAAGVLQRRGLIRYSRGSLRILDRRQLETAACECYGRLRKHDALLA